MSANQWWCNRCKISVHPQAVTFEEQHDSCGHPVEFIEIKTLQAELAALERDRARLDACDRVEIGGYQVDKDGSLMQQGKFGLTHISAEGNTFRDSIDDAISRDINGGEHEHD